MSVRRPTRFRWRAALPSLGLVLACGPGRPAAPGPWRMPQRSSEGAEATSSRAVRRGLPEAHGGELPDVLDLEPRDGWQIDGELAFAEARRLGRPVLIDFTAAWCLPCQLLEADTLSHPDVRERLASSFVALRVDLTEETRAGRALAERLGATRLPTLLLLSSDGRELDRLDHYIDANALVARLDRVTRLGR